MNELAQTLLTAPAARIRVLLVDDQKIIAEATRRMLADLPSTCLHYCADPTKAIDAAKQIRPTVILQDLVMPEVDGLTLVKFFRACPETREIPLVVLSSKEEPSVKYRAFENGANDYMVKFPDKLEVLARIQYHSNAYNILCERNEAMRKLQESQNALKRELDEAENYVISLLPAKIDSADLHTDWVFKSSTELGGDCFGYDWIDSDKFAIYLLDVCGHGVGAALLSVSAMNVLRSRTLSGIDFAQPDQVLNALNAAFDMDKQNGMYFTLWYGVYDRKTRTLSYASGGHPPAMLVATIGSPSAVVVGASSAVSSSAVGVGVASGAGVDALSAAAASGVGDASTGGAPSSMRTDAASSCSGSSQSRSLSASGAPPAAADAICRPNTVSPTQASFCRSVISAHLRLHSPQYIWFRGWNYVTASAILRAEKS